MRRALALLLVLAWPSLAWADSWKYCGELATGGHMVPAETSINRDAKGELTGAYSFTDNGQLYEGRLAKAQLMGSGAWRFTWTDTFGSGALDLTFNADASAFDGLWGVNQDMPRLAWRGHICIEVPAS